MTGYCWYNFNKLTLGQSHVSVWTYLVELCRLGQWVMGWIGCFVERKCSYHTVQILGPLQICTHKRIKTSEPRSENLVAQATKWRQHRKWSPLVCRTSLPFSLQLNLNFSQKSWPHRRPATHRSSGCCPYRRSCRPPPWRPRNSPSVPLLAGGQPSRPVHCWLPCLARPGSESETLEPPGALRLFCATEFFKKYRKLIYETWGVFRCCKHIE